MFTSNSSYAFRRALSSCTLVHAISLILLSPSPSPSLIHLSFISSPVIIPARPQRLLFSARLPLSSAQGKRASMRRRFFAFQETEVIGLTEVFAPSDLFRDPASFLPKDPLSSRKGIASEFCYYSVVRAKTPSSHASSTCGGEPGMSKVNCSGDARGRGPHRVTPITTPQWVTSKSLVSVN